MRRLAAGFTLLEVLIALLVVTVGVLGFAGTLASTAALAGKGRTLGRVAAVLGSRLDLLRSEVLANAPACLPPAAGVAVHEPGITESWSATVAGRLIDVRVETVARQRGGSRADTLITRIPCP